MSTIAMIYNVGEVPEGTPEKELWAAVIDSAMAEMDRVNAGELAVLTEYMRCLAYEMLLRKTAYAICRADGGESPAGIERVQAQFREIESKTSVVGRVEVQA